jgi:hypothetical protein
VSESWATYRQSLAGALGWHIFTSQSTASASATASTLVIPDLIDTNLEPNYLDTTWEYQPAGGNIGEVRRVLKGGLAPATGTVTLSRAHTATTSSGTSVEFYGVLPPVSALGRRGLLQAANLALGECWWIDEVDITGVAAQWQYSLAAYPWLQTEDQVIDVWARRSGDVRDRLVSQWHWLDNLDAPQIEFRYLFGPSDTIKIKAYRPLDSWIKVGATWADSTVGLVNDSDQAMISEQGMLNVGLYYCYEFLASEGDVSQRAQWRTLADRQRIKANKWKSWTLPTLDGRDRALHWSARSEAQTMNNAGNVFDAGNMDY